MTSIVTNSFYTDALGVHFGFQRPKRSYMSVDLSGDEQS